MPILSNRLALKSGGNRPAVCFALMSSTFLEQLQEWGPESAKKTVSLSEAEAYCARLARTHYENFPLVSWMLPKKLHQHFYNVYAYCRWSDDLGDEVGDSARALELLNWWRGELEACFADQCRHPVFIALHGTVREFEIPITPFADLLSAFEQDQTVKRYRTFDELRDYCRRSADPVGRIVLHLCGQFNDQNAAWSDSICTGLQLANFWQDVARDFDIGRVYLPQEDRERFGYSDRDLEQRITNSSFIDLMTFEVQRARNFLLEGMPLIAQLPGRLQVDIELFARGGLKILDRIEAIGYRVWETRPVVTKLDAVKIFAGCLWRSGKRRCKRR